MILKHPEPDARAAFSVTEFCSWAGISPSRFYKEVKSQRLKIHKIGRKTIVKTTDANAWLDSLPQAV